MWAGLAQWAHYHDEEEDFKYSCYETTWPVPVSRSKRTDETTA